MAAASDDNPHAELPEAASAQPLTLIRSSAPARGTPALPLDLVDIIVDLLRDDWRTLVTLLSVHPACASRAHAHISSRRGITLVVPDVSAGDSAPSDMSDFLRIFHPGSTLAETVTALTLRGDPRARRPMLRKTPALGCFPRLRSLTLDDVYVVHPDLIPCMLSTLAALEELHLTTVKYRLEGDNYEFEPPHAAPLPPQFPPRLCVLRITEEQQQFLDEHMRHVADALCRTFPPPPLQSVVLHFLPLRQHGVRLGIWCAALAHVRDSLTQLELTIPEPMGQIQAEGPLSALNVSFADTLAVLPALQHLALRFQPAPLRPTAPTRRTLTLTIPAPAHPLPPGRGAGEGDGGGEAADALRAAALVLSAPHAYPALRAVRVGVGVGVGGPGADGAVAALVEEALGAPLAARAVDVRVEPFDDGRWQETDTGRSN
ncbi:hypothetical protein BD413DRAFT_611947 [Trametes elegans]|nr:hypothetical protein BD413DRAFT_611947 [Trametes elegans]